jgi:hypothetical protein
MNPFAARLPLLIGMAFVVPACQPGSSEEPTPPPDPFSLTSPGNGATDLGIQPTFTWQSTTMPITSFLSNPGYTFELATEPSFANPILSPFFKDVPGALPEYTPVDSLTEGTLYYWRVIAEADGGSTVATGAPWTFTTSPPAAGPPSAFPGPSTIPSGAHGYPQLDFTYVWNPAPGASSYTLQVSKDSAFSTFVINQSDLHLTSVYPGVILEPTTLYYMRVLAVNSSGTTESTGLPGGGPYSFVTAGPPASFSLVSPADTAGNISRSPTFSWNPALSAASYTFDLYTAGLVVNLVHQEGLSSTTFTPSITLGQWTTYQWKVTAVNSSGSTWSFASFSTGP